MGKGAGGNGRATAAAIPKRTQEEVRAEWSRNLDVLLADMRARGVLGKRGANREGETRAYRRSMDTFSRSLLRDINRTD